jgi:hypothetical protein
MIECPREQEIVDAIGFGRWGADAELIAHAGRCAICGEVVEVARALHDDRAVLMREAHPPTAGMVWWRATIRARAEAAHTAMQPITLVQGVAGASVAGATAALVTLAWRWMEPADRIGNLLSRLALDRGAAPFTIEHALVAVIAVAACLVLAPLALYFTLADD